MVLDLADVTLTAPVSTLAQMLHNLLRNALDATEGDAPVHLAACAEGDTVVFRVDDRGTGLDPSIAERLGAPFVSTKAEGLGLGIYLARSYAERTGGIFAIEPRPGGGTTARLTVRRDVRTGRAS